MIGVDLRDTPVTEMIEGILTGQMFKNHIGHNTVEIFSKVLPGCLDDFPSFEELLEQHLIPRYDENDTYFFFVHFAMDMNDFTTFTIKPVPTMERLKEIITL